MIGLRSFVFFSILSFCIGCQSKSPHDMSIDELDGHIGQLQYLLDSLQTIRSHKAELDTSGIYAVPTNSISNLDDIFENTPVVFVKGKIDTSLSISSLRITQDRPYQRDYIHSISIDDDGAFSDELEIEHNGLFSLKFNSYTQNIYLENGKTVGIIIDSINKSGIRFIGDLSHENNFLTQKHDDLHELYHQQMQKTGEDIAEIKSQISLASDSIIIENDKYWAENKAEISSAFSKIITDKIKLTNSRAILSVAQNTAIEFSEEDFQPEGIPLDSDDLFQLYDFRKYLFEYFEYRADSALAKIDSIDSEQVEYWVQKYSLVDSLFDNNTITEFLKTDVLFESIAKIRSARLNPLVRKYKSDVSKSAFLSTINNRYNSTISPRRGTLAPDISGETFDGDDFRLAQMRGKYVYIFVWATWCGPCKIEIPFYERMLEDYADANIEFVGISVDKSKKKWTESFFYNDYPGLQVLVPGDWKSPLVTDYKISSIPQFILIDPEGEIVELNAERPTKNIKAQLSQYGIYAKVY